MITLYTHPLSGHAHRVELFLSLLGLEAKKVEVDLAAGAHKQPEFLAKNPLGQVPVLEDGDVRLADSTAILVYLAETYAPGRWIPLDPVGRARVQRILSLASNEIAHGPAAARLVTVFGAGLDHAEAKARAHRLLSVIEADLAGRDWLVGSKPSIADVAGYTYIAHAPEGGVSLEPYPAIRGWLARIQAPSGFVPMKTTPVGLAA